MHLSNSDYIKISKSQEKSKYFQKPAVIRVATGLNASNKTRYETLNRFMATNWYESTNGMHVTIKHTLLVYSYLHRF